ncbi:hypothetical protein CBM2609_B10112 [Cupriavidus taiwanensis]|nr:hypothetical protein CBM2604_B10110 [Cupriavidus taiwanensis]SOZ29837.1 hypothetical protein CBM2609_B10112 [Cupriavidus taiwanensis]SOZ46957.1 hypothetical protein CBM2610_B10110 [Cupriavidus taiwanensis]
MGTRRKFLVCPSGFPRPPGSRSIHIPLPGQPPQKRVRAVLRRRNRAHGPPPCGRPQKRVRPYADYLAGAFAESGTHRGRLPWAKSRNAGRAFTEPQKWVRGREAFPRHVYAGCEY